MQTFFNTTCLVYHPQWDESGDAEPADMEGWLWVLSTHGFWCLWQVLEPIPWGYWGMTVLPSRDLPGSQSEDWEKLPSCFQKEERASSYSEIDENILFLLPRPVCPQEKLFLLLLLLLLFVCFVFFLGPHPWHMEVPRLGVKSELQLPAYATATAMWNFSCVCDLHHNSRQCCILDPLGKARDQTHVLVDSRQICFCWATKGTPKRSCFTRTWLTWWKGTIQLQLHLSFSVGGGKYSIATPSSLPVPSEVGGGGPQNQEKLLKVVSQGHRLTKRQNSSENLESASPHHTPHHHDTKSLVTQFLYSVHHVQLPRKHREAY